MNRKHIRPLHPLEGIFARNLLAPALVATAIAASPGLVLAAPSIAAESQAQWMNFLASPAIAIGGYDSYPHVVQVRSGDVTNVVVHQPTVCGQRMEDGKFEVSGDLLLLRYSVPYRQNVGQECLSTAMFTIHGLPATTYQVVALPDLMPMAAAASEPAASMKFVASAATAVGGYGSYPHVVQVHSADVTNVVVHQPVACGERLRDARFEQAGDLLLLRYTAPYAGTPSDECISTGMFTIQGLPPGDFQVIALPELEQVTPVSQASSLSLNFLASPASAVGGYGSYPHVVQVRNGDVTNVVVHQPTVCGQRLADGNVELAGDLLLLRYSVPYQEGAGEECLSTAMFTIRGLPSTSLQVLALPDLVGISTAPAAASTLARN